MNDWPENRQAEAVSICAKMDAMDWRHWFPRLFKWKIIVRSVVRLWPKAIWRWAGGRWRWEALSGGAATLMRFGEWGFGWFLLSLATFAASSKIAHWKPEADWKPSAKLTMIVFGQLILFVSFAALVIISLSIKGFEPWSHLPAARDSFIQNHWPILALALKPPQAASVPQIRMPGYQSRVPSKPILPQPNGTTRTQTGLSLSVSLVGPSAPALVVENRSDSIADRLTWELVMFRTTDQALFSYPTQEIGYIKPHDKSARYDLGLENKFHAAGAGDVTTGQIMKGDMFIGCMLVDCPSCAGVTLIVGFTWGSSGWFYEYPGASGKLILPPVLVSKTVIAGYITFMEKTIDPTKRKLIE